MRLFRSLRAPSALVSLALTAILVAGCASAAVSPSAPATAAPATAAPATAAPATAAPATAAPATAAPATAAPATAAPAACAGAGVRVAMNHPLRVPFYEQISDGGRSAAKDCGAPELQVIGPSDFNLEATVQAVRDAISSGVQAIALNTYPPDLWVPVVEESLKKGTSFVGFNAGPVLLGSADSPLYVGPRESEFGRGLGTALADALGPDAKGDVIVGICSPGFSPLLDRVKGMTDLLAARSPGVTLSKPYDTTADQTKSFTTWSDLIQANPDALAFVGVCATDLPNLVKIKQADPNAKYLILGADLDLEALPALEDGTALAMIGQSPYMQGYIPVRMLIESIAMGKKIPSGWIDSGIEIVTKENAAAVREREGSLAATIAFYAPKVEEIFANPSAFVRPYEDLKK